MVGMQEQPELALRGDLVALEPLSLAHAEALLEVAVRLAPVTPYTRIPASLSTMREYISQALTQLQDGCAVPFTCFDIFRSTAGVVGTTRFLDVMYWDGSPTSASPGSVPTGAARWRPDAVEIGSTWFAREVQGRGHNTEAKLLMLDYAFDVWSVQRVSLQTDVRNVASRRAIEKLGATFEGVRRAHKRAADGSVRDSAYYSILASEWSAFRPEVEAELARQQHNS